MGKQPYLDRRWRTAVTKRLSKAKADGEPCHYCGHPIDWDDTEQGRWSPTGDHPIARAAGGDTHIPWREIVPMHRSCNSKKGKRSGGGGAPLPKPLRRSESW